MKISVLFIKVLFVITIGITFMLGTTSGIPARAAECPSAPESIQAFSDCEACNTDVDNNGRVTVTDLILVKKCIGSGCEDLAYDVSGDGKVSADDAAILLECLKAIKK